MRTERYRQGLAKPP